MKSSRSEVRQNRPSRLIGFFYKKIAKIGCFTNIFCKFAFSKSVITIIYKLLISNLLKIYLFNNLTNSGKCMNESPK